MERWQRGAFCSSAPAIWHFFPSQSLRFPSLPSIAKWSYCRIVKVLPVLLVELSEDPDKQGYGLAGLCYLIVLNSCVQNNGTPNLSEYYQLQIKEASNTKSALFCGLSINSIEDKLNLALCTFPCLPRPTQESLVHAVAWFCVCICYSHLLYGSSLCLTLLCLLANRSVFCS